MNRKRTFKLFEHLAIKPIDYYMTSYEANPQNPERPKINQPSRYNDRTIVGYEEKPKDEVHVEEYKDYDVFKVSEKHRGRIMDEYVILYERS